MNLELPLPPWVRRGLVAEVPDDDGLGVDLPSSRPPARPDHARARPAGAARAGAVRPRRRDGPGHASDRPHGAAPRNHELPTSTSSPRSSSTPGPALLLTPLGREPTTAFGPGWRWWWCLAPRGRDRRRAQPPLPRLTIDQPASAAAELPDLGESAWAHAHMVEAGGGADVPATLAAQPDLNVSRLLCPRRLEPDRDYVACLVPTTEAGRRAGLVCAGSGSTTGPAWSGGARAVLPLLPLVVQHRAGRRFRVTGPQARAPAGCTRSGAGRCSSGPPTRRCWHWRPTPAESWSSRSAARAAGG